ncbi:MAG: peptidoglycan-binding protein, partial [Clostridia bacterium]|nr:peptidoglycan-binding protein [Clostridia bacterium]
MILSQTRRKAFLLAVIVIISVLCPNALADMVLTNRDTEVFINQNGNIVSAGTIPVDTALNRVAVNGEWAMVTADGNTGVVRADSISGVINTKNATVYATCDTAIHNSYSAASGIVGNVPNGAAMTSYAAAGNWVYVSYNGVQGFVCLNALTLTPPAQPAPQPQPEQTMSVTAYASVDGARVVNTQGKPAGTVPLNTEVTVVAVANGICRVTRGGVTAYMLQSELSPTPIAVQEPAPAPEAPAPQNNGITTITPTTFYVQNNNAQVRNGNGTLLGTLPVNTALTVDAYNDTIAHVTMNGYGAFMLKSDLGPNPVQTEAPQQPAPSTDTTVSATFYVCHDNAVVKDGSGKTLCTLPLNTAVTVTGYNDTVARVQNGNVVAYMLKSDLSPSKTVQVIGYGATGDAVKSIQTRLQSLGYFSGSIGGNYLDLTKAAVIAFQTVHGLTATGECDEQTLSVMFSDSAKKNPALTQPAAGSAATPATGTAKEMDWWNSGIQSVFPRGATATITDVDTRIAWRETRYGGTNHADVQPTTAADTAAMKQAVGSWSWTRRAIFVTINGVNYAASMNCMPH